MDIMTILCLASSGSVRRDHFDQNRGELGPIFSTYCVKFIEWIFLNFQCFYRGNLIFTIQFYQIYMKNWSIFIKNKSYINRKS